MYQIFRKTFRVNTVPRCDFISTILRRKRLHFYRMRAGRVETLVATTLLINLSRGRARKEASNFHGVPWHRSRIYPSRENGAGALAKCAFTTRILAHLRKSKHFRQFGRLEANPLGRDGPVRAIKGVLTFSLLSVCLSLPDWPAIARPLLRKCTHVISR